MCAIVDMIWGYDIGVLLIILVLYIYHKYENWQYKCREPKRLHNLKQMTSELSSYMIMLSEIENGDIHNAKNRS